MEYYNLNIWVVRGVNLAIRDRIKGSSDPYVRLKTYSKELQTDVQKKGLQPEWNQLIGPFIVSPNTPITLEVWDKDTWTSDDPMGTARIDVNNIIEAARMDLTDTNNNTTIKTVQPTSDNFLGRESRISLCNGMIVQDMEIKLREVECGEVHLQLELLRLPISSGLNAQGQNYVYSVNTAMPPQAHAQPTNGGSTSTVDVTVSDDDDDDDDNFFVKLMNMIIGN